jgi:protein subunit release factor B
MSKQLLFSITRKDFDLQFYRSGGKGGQNVNKVATACRITHRDSGAIGQSDTHRTQFQNKKEAFSRLLESDKFKKWHKQECAKRLGHSVAEIEAKVSEWMKDKYIKVEYLGGE